jgi:pimeloyl-ACP methyl ester carboxylesterase
MEASGPSVLPFWSPEEELLAKLAENWPRRSSAGEDLDAFVSLQHRQELRKSRSWHHHPELPFFPWKEDFLKHLRHALIVPGAPGTPSKARVLQREEHGDFFVEHVELTLTPPFRATAIVTIPRNGRKKHPALVLLHSLGSLALYGKEKFLHRPDEPSYLTEYRQECYEGQSLLAEFARAGYLCIAIDALGFGWRTKFAKKNAENFEVLRKGMDAGEAEAESLRIFQVEFEESARTLGAIGLSLAAVTATDDLRTVDYLAGRDDVDRERIGCAGLSFGSFRANYLAALDDRIRAAASVCWISTLDGIIDYNIPKSLGFFAIPGGLYRNFDMVDIPIAIAPKPFLAISGWRDPLMEPRGAAAAHLSLRRAWTAARSPHTLGSLTFDAPHEFNREMLGRAAAFFDLHL